MPLPEPTHTRVFELVANAPGTPAWRLEGSSWHDPGYGALTAHDVYHHEPNDQGTLAEELMSFGVEHWLEGGGWAADIDEWSGDTFANGLAFVLSASVDRLALPPAPPLPADLPPHLASIWRRKYDLALMDFLVETREEGARRSAQENDDRLSPLDEPDYPDRLVAWVAEGWRRAQSRYPDPDPIQEEFNALAEHLDHLAAEQPVGTRVTLVGTTHGRWRVHAVTSPSPTLQPRKRRHASR